MVWEEEEEEKWWREKKRILIISSMLAWRKEKIYKKTRREGSWE